MIFKAIINWFFMDVSIQFTLYLIYSNLVAQKIIRTKKLIFIAPFEKGHNVLHLSVMQLANRFVDQLVYAQYLLTPLL